jgi:hypothetical protein
MSSVPTLSHTSEAIVQPKPNNVETVVERCAEGRWSEIGGGEEVVLGNQLHCLRTQIHELIFDLCKSGVPINAMVAIAVASFFMADPEATIMPSESGIRRWP